jgi:sulfatase modifying factor 1
MRKSLITLINLLATAALVPAQTPPADLVFIAGGSFKNPRSGYHGRDTVVSGFFIGRCEVTQKEWTDIMGHNPSEFKGDDLPVEMVSWYDCIEYCNQRSLKEGLTPYYTVDRNTKDPNNGNIEDDIKWTVTINPGANGYRLPTEAEWEYAASGGQVSQGHLYSGSDEADQVAWYWENSGETRLAGAWNWPAIELNGNRTKPVGVKSPNELGLHDMSGNVREWCWDWHGDSPGSGADPQGPSAGSFRVWKGGGWVGGDFCCAPSFRAHYDANSRGYDHGFRVCRSGGTNGSGN